MHADLDTLCTLVHWTSDDLLPERPRNSRRRTTNSEVVTLCVAQAYSTVTVALKVFSGATVSQGRA
jgi:hypothetical protein